MKLKINRWEFNVTNNDWVLDNGSIYQCLTLRHHSPTASMSSCYNTATIMSKKQFNELVKLGKLIDATEEYSKKFLSDRFNNCKIWRFNVEE